MQLATVKKIVKWCVGMSAGYVAGEVIANNIHPEKPRHKVEAIVGGAVISGIVAEKAEEYTDRTVDEIVNGYRAVKKSFTS
jgi:hypothetical protein